MKDEVYKCLQLNAFCGAICGIAVIKEDQYGSEEIGNFDYIEYRIKMHEHVINYFS